MVLSVLPENLKYDSTFNIVWRGEKDNQVRYLPANPLQDTENAYENVIANYLAHSFCTLDPEALKVALDLCMIGEFRKLLRNKYFIAAVNVKHYDGRRFFSKLLQIIDENIDHFECMVNNHRGEFAKYKIFNLKDSKEELSNFMRELNN